MKKLSVDVKVYAICIKETGEVVGKYLSIFDALVHLIYYLIKDKKLMFLYVSTLRFMVEE